MKKRQVQILFKAILPDLPELVTDGHKLLLFSPIGHTLRAFLVDDSSYSSEDFYFHWFFMPLCIPIDHLTLSYGERLKAPDGTKGWNASIPDLPMRMVEAVRRQALPHLLKLKTEDDVIAAMRSRVGNDIHVLRETGYLRILQNRFPEAEVALTRIISEEEPDARKWEKDIADEARSMVDLLKNDPNSAVQMVKQFREETLRNLRLEKWQ